MFDGIVNYIKERPFFDAAVSMSSFGKSYLNRKYQLEEKELKQQQIEQQQQAMDEEEKERQQQQQQQEIKDKAEELKNQAYNREDTAYQRMIADMKKAGINVGLLSSIPTPVSSLSNTALSGDYNINSQQLQHIQNLDLQEMKNDFDYLINSINNNVTIEENKKQRLVSILTSLFNFASSLNMASAIKSK